MNRSPIRRPDEDPGTRFLPDDTGVLALQCAARGASHITRWSLEDTAKKLDCSPSKVAKVSSYPVPSLAIR